MCVRVCSAFVRADMLVCSESRAVYYFKRVFFLTVLIASAHHSFV